ncbi:hypothetical protein LZC95_51390 [Pendulispora brunnea]|uniref:Uncharacterized protein n=1 Tax=Pendulispora brunnea TaxID=2905690 RepID=A0ABZ2K812_9BACT
MAFAACSDDNDGPPNKPSGGSDAGSDQSTTPLPDTGTVDSASGDAGTCDYDQKTADGGRCDLRKTHVRMSRLAALSCEAITRGQFCDRIFFQVPADAGASVSAIAPSFKCAPGGQGLQCTWEDPPNQLDENGFAQICALTTSSIDLSDEGITCMIYL